MQMRYLICTSTTTEHVVNYDNRSLRSPYRSEGLFFRGRETYIHLRVHSMMFRHPFTAHRGKTTAILFGACLFQTAMLYSAMIDNALYWHYITHTSVLIDSVTTKI